MNIISIAKDYTDAPGPRYKDDGEFSGEDFREIFLEPIIERGVPTLIDLDGLYGSPTSFFEEAFGGLVRKFGAKRVISLISFRSTEDPFLVEEIQSFISDAASEE